MPRLSYVNFVLIVANAIALVVLATRYESSSEIEILSQGAPGNLDGIVVQISGAISEPGVYRVDPGDRVADLVEMAGGFTSEADERQVNLALRLRDEDRIDVPWVAGRATVTPETALLDLNSATAAELDELPGIGPVYAGKIIEARELQHFSSSDDLLEREVLPEHVYEGIRMLVTARP